MNRPSADDPPTILGYPVADMAGGMYTALSILGALLSRELGCSDGEYIGVSMTEMTMALSGCHA